MSLAIVGLSHHTSPVELRERLHFPPEKLPGALLALRKHLQGAHGVILSTCNRVEIYGSGAMAPEELAIMLREFLSMWHETPLDEFRNQLYEYTNEEAAGHLFRVASGLDSLVLGESQIMGQVHDAFLAAQAEQTTDKALRALFQRAASVAKNVRHKCGVGEGKVSIGSVAADLAVSIFMELTGKTVMVIGSGKMGELTLARLVDRGAAEVLLVNRSAEKATQLAQRFRGEALAFGALPDNLHRADIVISSTAAEDYVLRPPHFQQALRARGQEPMFVIDIAVPRDVDPKVNDLDNIYLYDVDDLREVSEANIEERRRAIGAGMEIIDEGVEQFWNWLQGLAAEPTIVSMSRELNAIRERELEKTLASLGHLDEKDQQEVAYLTKRLVNAILQRPMTQLKREVAEQSHDPHTVLHLVKRLFGLKEQP